MSQHHGPESGPLGTYRPTSVADAASMIRDGMPYYEINALGGATPTFEVRFGDGIWMLAQTEDLVPAFTLFDGWGRWLPVSYETDFTGRKCPRLTQDTLLDIALTSNVKHQWDGVRLTVSHGEIIDPDADDLYRLPRVFGDWRMLSLPRAAS